MSTVWILHCQHCHPGLGSSLTVFQCLRNVFLYSQNPQTSTCRSIIIQLWARLKQEGERTCCPKVSACFAWLKPPHKAPGAVPEQGRGQPVAPAAPQILPIVTSSCPLHPAVPGRLSACPAQSSGTLVCSQGAEDTNQSSISFPQPIVPGQGAVQPRLLLPSPAILRSPGQGASWQLQEEQNLLLAALGGRELRAHRHLPCWVWKQENPPEKQIPMQSTKWGFSLRWGKIESVQNFHGCIKKSPCEAQSGSYLEPQPWNLISPTAAAMVGRAAGFSAIIFLMDLSHFAQMNRHRNSPCSSGGQCRDSNRCPSLCSFHSSASPRLAFPALGSRSAEQKAAGLCTLKSRFQSPGAEMLVQPTQRGSEGQQRVQETQQTFSFTI